MGNGVIWALWFFTVILWGLTIVALAFNGISEVVSGQVGFLPFDKWLRKRQPATQSDFVLHGAAQLVQALGSIFIAAPLFFMTFLSAIDLTTDRHLPVPFYAGLLVFALYVVSLTFGTFLGVYSHFMGTKVNYVKVDAEARGVG